MSLRLLPVLLLLSTAAFPAHAANDPKPALRILRDQCLGCHKPGKAKGGLLLTTREKALAGGDSGAAFVGGKAADSLLYQLVLKDGDPHMPPKKQLPEAEIAVLKNWIDAGADWDLSVFDELPVVEPLALGSLPKTYQPVLALALAPDDKRLAVARGNVIALYDLTKPDRPLLGHLSGIAEPVQSLAWTPDGKQIISGGFRQVRVWDAATLEMVAARSDKLVGPITAVVVSKDGQTVFAADGEPSGPGFIHRINLATMVLVTTWKAHDDNIYVLRLSPDGQRLASASADKLARIWNVSDGKLTGTYEGHTNHVLAVAFNKDATQIATAGADREVKVWDVKSGEQEVSLGDKKIVFTSLAWTPDGKYLVAVTDKGGGSIFSELQRHTGGQRSDTGKATKLAGVKAMLYAVAVTADGKTVFAGSDGGRVYLWDASGKEAGLIEPPK